jgi:histidinol dehydrogenase
MKIVVANNRRAVRALLSRARVRDAATDRIVSRIVDDVRANGDAALLKYARKLDRLSGEIAIGTDEMRAAARRVPREVRAAIKTAARNIRTVA